MPSRPLALALAVLTTLACQKATPAPAAPDAAVAVAAPRDAGAPAPVVEPPLTPSTLSLFEPAGGGCAWRRLDPVTDAGVVLATFPGDCVGARVSWSPDAKRALVWFDPGHLVTVGYAARFSSPAAWGEETAPPDATPRLFLVSLAARTFEALPFPAVAGHEVSELGLDGEAGPVALLEQPLEEAVLKKGSVKAAGQTFDLKQFTEGLPELVHAYRLEGGAWKRVETAVTTTGWDYGPGVRDLQAWDRLGPRSVELSASHAQGDVVEGKLETQLWTLAPRGAQKEDGEWIFLGAGGARLYVWEISGEFAHTTGLLATGAPPRVLPGLGFTDGDLVAVRTSGPWVLVTAQDVGAHPRLYELPAGRLVFSSDTARATTLWPTSAAPESHEAPAASGAPDAG